MSSAFAWPRKEKRNGRNRRTEEDPSDPGASESPTAEDGTGTISAFDTSSFDPSAGEDPSEPLIPEVSSALPILAKREAHLVLESLEYSFKSVTRDCCFGAFAQATCYRGRARWTHHENPQRPCALYEIPEVDCSCGFYAVPPDQPDTGYATMTSVTLLVELSGKVIEHDLGFRGQFQRVVECQIQPCIYCGRASDSVLLGPDLAVDKWVCEGHVVRASEGWCYLAVADLERRIGVPVTRLELPPLT